MKKSAYICSMRDKNLELWDLDNELSIPYRKIRGLDPWANIPQWRYKMNESGFFQKVYTDDKIIIKK